MEINITNIFIAKTRNNFCDQNFFIYPMKMFNDLPKDTRNKNNYMKFVNRITFNVNNLYLIINSQILK